MTFGTDKPCIHTGPGRSLLYWFSYLVPDGFTCESDSVWNCTVLGIVLRLYRPNTIQVNHVRVDLNRTELIWCKRSLKVENQTRSHSRLLTKSYDFRLTRKCNVNGELFRKSVNLFWYIKLCKPHSSDHLRVLWF